MSRAFSWLSSFFGGATETQQEDIYDAFVQALGETNPGLQTQTEGDFDVPSFTSEEADVFNEVVNSEWQNYLNPAPSPLNLEIPIKQEEPAWTNYVLAKDLFDFDQFNESFVPGETIEPTRRKVYSNYFITINTNMMPPVDRAYEMANAFRSWLVNFVFTNNTYAQVFTLNQGRDAFDNNNVEKITTIIVVEIGKKSKRLHAHVLLNVAHKSRLTIDFKAFKQILDGNPHDPNKRGGYYVNWLLGKDRNYVIDYMAKGTVRQLQQKDLLSSEPSLKALVTGYR